MYKILSKKDGVKLITLEDKYISNMSLEVMTSKMGSNSEIDKSEFLNFLSTCVMDFEKNEKELLNTCLKKMFIEFDKHGVENILSINIVKTNGKDEWNSAYTRGNTIYLPMKKMNSYSQEKLYDLILHEYFHIYSRYNEGKRKELYKLMDFEETDKNKIAEKIMKNLIFNPDALTIVSTEIAYKGEAVKALPLIVMEKIDIDSSKDIINSIKMKAYIPELDILVDLKNLEQLTCKLLINTGFPQHPEETLAENFVYLFRSSDKLSDISFIESMRRIMMKC